MRTKTLLLILLGFLFSSGTFVAAFGRKPAPLPKETNDEMEIVVTPATLKRKATSLLVGCVAASTTDFIVHRFVNETQRHEYKYDKVKYRETYIYAGEFGSTAKTNHFFFSSEGITHKLFVFSLF